MKISILPYRLRLRAPLATAHGEVHERVGFVVAVAGGGREGRGEAAPLPWLGTEGLAESQAALEAAAHALSSCAVPGDLTEVEATLARLPSLTHVPAARHAIELALLDLAAQVSALPLARLLDAGAPLEIPVSALLTAREPAALAREARSASQEGFGTVKLKVAQGSLAADLARAGVVRDAVGPAVRLRLDANGGWSEGQAADALRRLSRLSIEMCEQPIPPGDPEALRRLRAASVAIAADESMRSSGEAERLLDGERPAVDAIVLKPMVLGGVLPALRWAERARARGVRSIVTTALESAIGRAGAAHLAAALRAHESDGPAAGLATGRLLAEDLCPDPCPPARGRLVLRELPGLGFEP